MPKLPQEDYYIVSGGLWLKLEPIKAFVHVSFTNKNEEDPIKTESARVPRTFLPL